MGMKRCEKGHFYYSEKTPFCPYCSNAMSSGDGTTHQLNMDIYENIQKTYPVGVESGETPKTSSMDYQAPYRPGQGEQEKTRPVIDAGKGTNPVVGWLVCTEGGDKGRDYRIRAEKNFIGRSEKMDICIRGDDTISRDAHAIISYDVRKSVFRLYQGDSKGIVYLNDEEVITAVELKPYDMIELGRTKLVFIPFCGEKFKWI